jgi:hypothetical protein
LTFRVATITINLQAACEAAAAPAFGGWTRLKRRAVNATIVHTR